MRQILTYILLFASGLFLVSAVTSDYDTLSLKGNRFYSQKEWASALAMYELMLDSRPSVPSTYGKAIVAASLLGDRRWVDALTEQALSSRVPFDSLFSRVRMESFALGQTNLYEDYLVGIGEKYPWMSRAVDNYLTSYYLFRRNGDKMIEYSRKMLAGVPEDAGFLSVLAQGYMLTGKSDSAAMAWERIVMIHPGDYQALVSLGNYYLLAGECEKGLPYIEKAYIIRPTPMLAKLIGEGCKIKK